MSEHLRALILEDRSADAELVAAELRRQDVVLDWERVETEEEFVRALSTDYDVILSDFTLPGFDALAALRHVRERGLDVPVIVVTGAVGEETAAACIREGAADYLLKDRLGRLGLAVRGAVQRRRLEADRHRIESALVESQAELATVFESAPVPMLIVDRALRVVRANREALGVARTTSGDLFGRSLGEAVGCATHCEGDDGAGAACARDCSLRDAVRETLDTGTAVHGRECALDLRSAPEAAPSVFLVATSPLETTGGRLAVVALNDITARKRAEERERKLNLLLATIRDVNQLIVRETDQERLLAETCRIAVERGGFAMAWVGEMDPETRLVRPVAVAGRDEGYLAAVGIGRGGSLPGRGPVGTALGSGSPVFVDDIDTDPRMSPWREEAAARGFRSEAALPLSVRGRMFGVLVVYADRPAVFDGETRALLEEMSDDLAFAIGALETAREHTRAVAALQEAEERYRQLFEAESDAILLIDNATGRLLEANSAAEAMYGYPREQLLALRNVDLSAEPERTHRVTVETEADPEAVITIPLRLHRRSDGTVFPVEITGRFFTWKGRPVHVAAIRDITDRRKLQTERDLVFELAIDLFCVAGFDGHFKQLNPAWEATLGWSLEHLLAVEYLELVHPHDREATREVARSLAEGQPLVGFENRYECRDGSYRWLSWNARPSMDEDLMFAVARDITARKNLEEQLLQSQKMEAVGRLAGGVAHDFNNLLQALLSQSQLVRAFAGNPERLEKVAAELDQHIQRGAALTRQLLLFSRRDAPRRQEIDLNRVIQEHATLLRRLVRENIAFEIDLTAASLPVLADHGQLEQVLMNLVVNASDVLEGGGTITLRSGGDADAVWLTVEDDGPGVPAEARDRIFEPFFTTKAPGKGTGLGLSVVHGIVTQHGGRVEFDDRPDGGTVFRVRLPRVEAQRATASSVATAPALNLGHGERILLVEDEDSTRDALAELLAALQYAPTTAANAEEALALPDHPPFDAVLTDLMLPGKPGDQLARELEEKWPGLAVVVMSGYTEDEVVRRGIADGSVRFLQKPFGLRTLAQTLAGALGASSGS